MEAVNILDRYRRYLDAIDEEAAKTTDGEEYSELLGQGEVVDLLCTRDELAELSLTQEQMDEVARLDDLLVKHRTIMTDNLPPLEGKSAWWWNLHRGPQVREEAERAA